jgi:23S rRNA pseudouridine1911/1915/1917 synthase
MKTRTFKTDAAASGRRLAEFLSDQLRLTRTAVERLIRGKRVRVAGTVCIDPRFSLQRGQHVLVQLSATGPRPSKAQGVPPTPRQSAPGLRPAIVYADAHLVVVNKPAGLTTMRHSHEAAEFGERGRRFLPPTLQDLLPDLLSKGRGKERLRAVHRLDKETSGLVVFARTPVAESNLGRQFRAHTTERLYLAVVRGRPREGRIESWLVRDRGDGRRGSALGPVSDRAPAPPGQHAVTLVRVIESLGNHSLVECRLETGRTHQVRIHLGEAGAPVCGERVYDRPLASPPVRDDSGATRVMLHAATLGFAHPAGGERVRWEVLLPPDMARLLKRLRRRKSQPD